MSDPADGSPRVPEDTWISPGHLVRRAAEAISGPAYGPAAMRKGRAATVAVLGELTRYFTGEADKYRAPGSEQVVETYDAVLHDLVAAAVEIEEDGRG